MAIQIAVQNRHYYHVRDWPRHSARAKQNDERVALIYFSQLLPKFHFVTQASFGRVVAVPVALSCRPRCGMIASMKRAMCYDPYRQSRSCELRAVSIGRALSRRPLCLACRARSSCRNRPGLTNRPQGRGRPSRRACTARAGCCRELRSRRCPRRGSGLTNGDIPA
jgi:hypothetical protein